MFKIPIIILLVMVSISAPATALILLPIAWLLYDSLRKKHAENKRVLGVFIDYQSEQERLKRARAL